MELTAVRTLEEAFTAEEIVLIKKCMAAGQDDSIPSALESLGAQYTMTQERESALQSFLDANRSIPLDSESAVRDELTRLESQGYRIETPEQEAEWQAKIDAELAMKLAAKQARQGNIDADKETESTHEKIAPSEDDPSEVVNGVDEMTKSEITNELKSLGVKIPFNSTKAELYALLEGALKK